jgi:hypothetical protein
LKITEVKTKEDFILYQQSVIERQSDQIVSLMEQIKMLLRKLAEKETE